VSPRPTWAVSTSEKRENKVRKAELSHSACDNLPGGALSPFKQSFRYFHFLNVRDHLL